MDDQQHVIERLRRLAAAPIDPATDARCRERIAQGTARPRRSLRHRGKLALGVLAGMLAGTSGLAVAGALPGPVQRAAHVAFESLGIDIPDVRGSATEGVETRCAEASADCPLGTSDPRGRIDREPGGPDGDPEPTHTTTEVAPLAQPDGGAGPPASTEATEAKGRDGDGPPSSKPPSGATPATPADPGGPGTPATPATPATPKPPNRPPRPEPPATPADPGAPGSPATPSPGAGNPNPGGGNPNPGNPNPGGGNPNPGNPNPGGGNPNPGNPNPGGGTPNPGNANPPGRGSSIGDGDGDGRSLAAPSISLVEGAP